MALAIPKRLQGQSPSHARARAQEKGLAKQVGGRVTKGSGNGIVKGDVRLKGFVRIEAKTTKNRSFSVTEEIIDKLEAAVFGTGELPMLDVEILGGAKRFVVIPGHSLDLIMEALRAARQEAE